MRSAVVVALIALAWCGALAAPTASTNAHDFSVKRHRQPTVNTNLQPEFNLKREPLAGVEKVVGPVVAASPSNATSFSLSPCKGDNRGSGLCNMDPTHRVCAKVKSTDFFDVAGVTNFESRIGAEGFWCVPMFAMDKYVSKRSCADLMIDCSATDSRVCSGRDTSPLNRAPTTAIPHARECFAEKCPGRC